MQKKNLIVMGVCAAVILLMVIRSRGLVSVDSGQRIVMGTFAHITVVARDKRGANALIEAGFKTVHQLETQMSRRLEGSEVSKINRDAFDQPVVVSAETFEVIKKAKEYGKLTDGAFDITVAPLIELWKEAEDTNTVPSPEQIAQTEAKVGYQKLILDANDHSVRFAVAGMKIDLGGIAKGYSSDKVIRQLQEGGAAGGLVAIAGDIRCFGRPANNKKSWNIGLQNPVIVDNYVDDEPLLILKLTNQGISTSGDYRRFVSVGGKRYSHIINPHTGTSAEDFASVTIIAPRAVDADALATAVSVLGTQKGLALIESLPGVDAILIPHGQQQRIIKTSGTEKLIIY
jgi:FAD:protein FMN transferase